MPVHIPRPKPGLTVVFERADASPVVIDVPDGMHALVEALRMLLAAWPLRDGDRLTIDADGAAPGPEPDLPQVSRAAHYS